MCSKKKVRAALVDVADLDACSTRELKDKINELVQRPGHMEDDSIVLTCGHTFHVSCLGEFLDHSVTNKCPSCQKPIIWGAKTDKANWWHQAHAEDDARAAAAMAAEEDN
jgi:hypothetical protein